ncbi:NADH dehydrogenase i chain n [Luminiphilus syltensis NOR5-1B]|uniref:NADH-quinone oxidoreductase subunit N n=1 Tax=Luminiphilus syltensis NOR5-1B TaxID=565045 RepID=B8KTG8_9GAMM|nr:NADH-quinone oxidoreductase subunit N [Luminiphilus syltensis]EED35002.1 NADH dehydrogenase i chain n [Luminiphilus syltensis NOR5-1B]
MTPSADFSLIMPVIVLGVGATAVMLQVAARRSPELTRFSTLLVLIAALASSVWIGSPEPGIGQAVTPLLQADDMARLFAALFCASAALCVMLSRDYLPGLSDQGDEYYLLLLLATLGAVVLAYASHVASLLLGLELMSVALYALIAYPSRVAPAAEAATKYLVLSGGASATLLFGFALLYAATGSLAFPEIGAGLQSATLGSAVTAIATVLVITGVCFKLSAAPFHLWTPDVYEGSPAPVTAFLATVAKAAPFVALIRFLFDAQLFDLPGVVEVLGVLAVLSMLVGNLLALLQRNVKRMLAYSSIAHIGYALIIFTVAADPVNRALAGEAAVFYLVAYVPTTIAAFGLLALVNPGGEGQDHAEVQDLSGLFWRDPMLAILMLVALLSLAGIPLTAGFIGKFYLFAAAVSGSHWVLLAALVLGSAIGIYYYLRVIFQMSQKPAEHELTWTMDGGMRAVALLLTVAILGLGIVPQALMEYIRGMF